MRHDQDKALSLKEKIARATPLTREDIENYLWRVGVTKYADDEIDDKVLAKLNPEQLSKVEQLVRGYVPYEGQHIGVPKPPHA